MGKCDCYNNPMRALILALCCFLTAAVSAATPVRDTAAELRAVDKLIKENEAAQEWYQNAVNKSKDLIFVTIHSPKGPEVIP
jgi:hypothetical protein